MLLVGNRTGDSLVGLKRIATHDFVMEALWKWFRY